MQYLRCGFNTVFPSLAAAVVGTQQHARKNIWGAQRVNITYTLYPAGENARKKKGTKNTSENSLSKLNARMRVARTRRAIGFPNAHAQSSSRYKWAVGELDYSKRY